MCVKNMFTRSGAGWMAPRYQIRVARQRGARTDESSGRACFHTGRQQCGVQGKQPFDFQCLIDVSTASIRGSVFEMVAVYNRPLMMDTEKDAEKDA